MHKEQDQTMQNVPRSHHKLFSFALIRFKCLLYLDWTTTHNVAAFGKQHYE